jgi:hypothetical protein
MQVINKLLASHLQTLDKINKNKYVILRYGLYARFYKASIIGPNLTISPAIKSNSKPTPVNWRRAALALR